MLKKISFAALVVFYFVAGINHFINPAFYVALIPPYLPNPDFLQSLAGVFEILFSFLLILPKTRKWAVYGILLMLIAFIPAHIYSIELGGSIPNSINVPAWVVWARLLVIHPFLMIWAWWHRS